jgi:hypothetical protein
MIAGGERGAIVNIGSGCSKVPFPNLVDYSASKAAIDQFTRSAAIELGPTCGGKEDKQSVRRSYTRADGENGARDGERTEEVQGR